MFEFLEIKSTIKICYDLKRCLLPLVNHNPYFCGTSISLLSSLILVSRSLSICISISLSFYLSIFHFLILFLLKHIQSKLLTLLSIKLYSISKKTFVICLIRNSRRGFWILKQKIKIILLLHSY
jgi:hypothetical protein